MQPFVNNTHIVNCCRGACVATGPGPVPDQTANIEKKHKHFAIFEYISRKIAAEGRALPLDPPQSRTKRQILKNISNSESSSTSREKLLQRGDAQNEPPDPTNVQTLCLCYAMFEEMLLATRVNLRMHIYAHICQICIHVYADFGTLWGPS